MADKGIMMILGKKPKKEDKSEEKEGDSGYSAVAQEILDAVKDEDADALAEALKSFVEKCRYDSED